MAYKDEIISMMEIPFEEGGRTEKGCDCWGLVKIFYKRMFNIELPSFGNVYIDETGNFSQTSDSIEKLKDTIVKEVNNPQYGDIVLMNMTGRPTHIGVIIDNKTMIHTGRKTGVVIEDFSGVKWNKRIMGYYRPIAN